MELKIGREILGIADRCSRKHRCLSGPWSEPQAQVIGTKRFLCQDPDPCAYKFPFGTSFFCTCPVRQHIYETHGK